MPSRTVSGKALFTRLYELYQRALVGYSVFRLLASSQKPYYLRVFPHSHRDPGECAVGLALRATDMLATDIGVPAPQTQPLSNTGTVLLEQPA